MPAIKEGFKGISFPFRIGVKGGVVMSSTSPLEVPHIIEAMEQILLTRPLERTMEYHIGTEIDYNIFEMNDVSTHTLIAFEVREALKALEDRIEVIDVKVVEDIETNSIFAEITFKVLTYGTTYSTKLKVGERDVSSINARD